MTDEITTDIESAENLQLEIVEQPKTQLPIYHWSEIASPRYKGSHNDLMCGEVVTVTQSVHKTNVTPKTTKATPALVVYDIDFLGYKLFESVAQLISEYLEYEDINRACGISKPENRNTLNNQLSDLLLNSISKAIYFHTKTAADCREIGIDIGNDSSTILRSVKALIARKNKAS